MLKSRLHARLLQVIYIVLIVMVSYLKSLLKRCFRQINTLDKVKTFKFLGSLLTNQNSIQEEIKCKLKAGDPCYYSVQTLLSSRLLSKNLKIKIYKTIISRVMQYGCETRSLTLREESRLRVFENRILR